MLHISDFFVFVTWYSELQNVFLLRHTNYQIEDLPGENISYGLLTIFLLAIDFSAACMCGRNLM